MKLMRLKYYTGLLLIAAASLSSCKKVIKLDLGNDSGKLVIEGNITDEETAIKLKSVFEALIKTVGY